jgi:hypothetical protein
VRGGAFRSFSSAHTLVYPPLFKLQRLAPIERTLFRSPYILRAMGFNALQIEEGFYETPEGQRPFTARAIADCFAKTEPDDFLENQQGLLDSLAEYCPGGFLSGLWVMDSVHIHVPNGAHTDAHAFKVCVLGVWQGSVVWPLLWAFVPERDRPVQRRRLAEQSRATSYGTQALRGQYLKHLLLVHEVGVAVIGGIDYSPYAKRTMRGLPVSTRIL